MRAARFFTSNTTKFSTNEVQTNCVRYITVLRYCQPIGKNRARKIQRRKGRKEKNVHDCAFGFRLKSGLNKDTCPKIFKAAGSTYGTRAPPGAGYAIAQTARRRLTCLSCCFWEGCAAVLAGYLDDEDGDDDCDDGQNGQAAGEATGRRRLRRT